MINLSKDELKKLRARIIDIMTNSEDKTPVDKLSKLIDVYVEQTDNKKTDIPAHEVEDVQEEDIGEFPTVH